MPRQLIVEFEARTVRAATDDHATADTEHLQDLSERFAKVGTRDAHKLSGWAGWIEQGAEEIKNGSLAATCAEFAGSSDVFECRVIMRSKKEGEIPFLK